jgi:thiol-disulfide isomerase/thioredoxin
MLIVACVFSALSLAALGVGFWLLAQLRAQQQRLESRIDALAGRLWARAAVPAESAPPSTPEPEKDWTNLLAGTAIPDLTLDALTGGRATLASLLAPAKPLLLLFTDPRCGPCYELLPDLGGWQRVYSDQLSFALISTGEPNANIAMTAEYDIRPVLLQQEQEAMEAFGLNQQPAAVIVQPDGIMAAGPRYGSYAIRKLVADTLGLMMPVAPNQPVQVVGVGQTPPPLRRPDLSGQPVDLGGARSEPTLVLFWSPGCSGCQQLLPEIKTFESTVERLRVVIVSRGPVGLNQEVGFQSRVVLDDDRSLGQTFGVTGTPSAVLLDEHGVVVTPVARGHEGVRSALQALATSFAP